MRIYRIIASISHKKSLRIGQFKLNSDCRPSLEQARKFHSEWSSMQFAGDTQVYISNPMYHSKLLEWANIILIQNHYCWYCFNIKGTLTTCAFNCLVFIIWLTVQGSPVKLGPDVSAAWYDTFMLSTHAQTVIHSAWLLLDVWQGSPTSWLIASLEDALAFPGVS